jgi:hypothetical protein
MAYQFRRLTAQLDAGATIGATTLQRVSKVIARLKVADSGPQNHNPRPCAL